MNAALALQHPLTLRVVPLKPGHLAFFGAARTEPVERLVVPELSLALLDGPRVLAAWGVVPQHAHRATGWTLSIDGLTPKAWGVMLKPTLALLDRAQTRGYRRLEAYVRADHAAGLRWAYRLGFQPKAFLEQFLEDGGAVFMCERLTEPG